MTRKMLQLVETETFRLSVTIQDPDPYSGKFMLEITTQSYNEQDHVWNDPRTDKHFLTGIDAIRLGEWLSEAVWDYRGRRREAVVNTSEVM